MIRRKKRLLKKRKKKDVDSQALEMFTHFGSVLAGTCIHLLSTSNALGSVPGRGLQVEHGLVSALGFQPLWEIVIPKAAVGPAGHTVYGCSMGKAAQMRWHVS